VVGVYACCAIFVGSALTISFGLACGGDTFDRSAFNVLFQKVWGLDIGCCLSFGLGFTFWV